MSDPSDSTSASASTQRIDHFLQHQLESLKSESLGQLIPAMEYALLNGGKRMRPLLVYATAKSVGVSLDIADHIAAAIEMIHAYSLIHDDLPAMDDDDLRRGQPTCHIQFDEATAILAADALQALAFEVLAKTPTEAVVVIELIKGLSVFAGARGMVGGQMLDLEAENRTTDLAQLQDIHARKTGALLQSCVYLVTLCQPALKQDMALQYQQFAQNFGMIYQITDDILDVTGDTQVIGKPAQSDIKNNKSTYPGLLGIEGAQQKVNEHILQAQQALQSLPRTQQLNQLLQRVQNRKS